MINECILKRFFQKHPIERFLFGTDSPFTDQMTELQFLNNLSFLTPAQKEKVAGENAAKLLNLTLKKPKDSRSCVVEDSQSSAQFYI